MTWKEYEQMTQKYFKLRFPNSSIKHNVMLDGIKSKIKRQIDVFIEEIVCGYKIQMVVECKDWAKPLDVGDVEQFIAKLEDVGVDKGIMVSKSGYSKAAKELSYSYNHIHLHVLKFDELKLYQNFWGIPYRGRFGMIVFPPNGWILQSKVPRGFETSTICSMYPMEYDLDSAIRERNVIFVDIPELNIDDNIIGNDYINEFIKIEEQQIYTYDNSAEIEYQEESINNNDVTIRITKYNKDNYIETAGIAHFDNFIIFIFGAHDLRDSERYLTHIKYIFKSLVPIEITGVDPTNSHQAWFEFVATQYKGNTIVNYINNKN